MNDAYWVPASHDDGRRIMVGPVQTEAGARRLVTEIGQMGWHSGTPMHRMTRAAWFTMAYRERQAAAKVTPAGPHPGEAASPSPSPETEEAPERDPEQWWCQGEECYGEVTDYPHVHTYGSRPLRAVDIATGLECDVEAAKARLAELNGKAGTDD